MGKTETLNVVFTCSKCGPTKLELPDNYTGSDHARCKFCGADFGRYDAIRKRAMAVAQEGAEKMARLALQNLKAARLLKD